MRRAAITCATLLTMVLGSIPVSAGDLHVDKADGGSVVTDLGHEIKVNKGSSLHRLFVTMNDSSSPAQIHDSGLVVEFSSSLSRYSFARRGAVNAAEGVSAFEVRHVLFGMFGEWIKTLSSEEVVDVEKGASFDLHEEATWIATEPQVERFLTVVSFVANARTAGGDVWRCDTKKIAAAINQLNLSLGPDLGALDTPPPATALH